MLALILGIASILSGFSNSPAVGWTVVVGLVVGAPIFAWIGFKILPYTPFVLVSQLSGHAKKTGLEVYLGATAETVSQLRPSGKVVINGKRFDALSQDEIIDSGTEVVVIAIRSGELIVKTK